MEKAPNLGRQHHHRARRRKLGLAAAAVRHRTKSLILHLTAKLRGNVLNEIQLRYSADRLYALTRVHVFDFDDILSGRQATLVDVESTHL